MQLFCQTIQMARLIKGGIYNETRANGKDKM